MFLVLYFWKCLEESLEPLVFYWTLGIHVVFLRIWKDVLGSLVFCFWEYFERILGTPGVSRKSLKEFWETVVFSKIWERILEAPGVLFLKQLEQVPEVICVFLRMKNYLWITHWFFTNIKEYWRLLFFFWEFERISEAPSVFF